jgi:uncharacterized membrane-anchored protein YitT (DUF2179 family)/predicted metal-dependent HD superfamily phosphohydrolase
MPETGTTFMQYDAAYSLIVHELENKLPVYVTYHNAAHTKSVVEAAILLSESEGVSEEEKTIIKTAALFHDAGFLKSNKNHEEGSCAIARRYLPDFGYSGEQIEAVCRCILATRLPQKPASLMEKILCDADLHYLGTNDYAANAERLFREFRHFGTVKSRNEWNERQIRFLGAHRFFTQSAIDMYQATKEANAKSIAHYAQQHRNVGQLILNDCSLIAVGVLSAGFALKGFLVPNHFFDGGVTGISLLVHELFHVNLAYVIIALNLPFIVAGYFSVGKQFAYKTVFAIVLLGIFLLLLPYPVITSDKLLISIFGGVFLGLGVGLVMRAGGALDGIEVVALHTLRRTNFTITEVILGLNIIIFSIAAFQFGVESALYSVLTYYSATRMINYVVEGWHAYIGVTIVSGESDLIKNNLVNEMGRAITVYKGERGFLPGKFHERLECDIIFTVVSRMEFRKLKNIVYESDGNAFIFVSTIRDAAGGIIQQRRTH